MNELQLRPKQAYHIIGGNHAGQLFLVVHNGQSDEVVFVEKFGDFFLAGTGMG